MISESDADALLRTYVLEEYRHRREYIPEPAIYRHLASCPSVRVTDLDASDGTYGCDTGCEYVRFEALIGCDHGQQEAYEFGGFDTLAGIVEYMGRGRR